MTDPSEQPPGGGRRHRLRRPRPDAAPAPDDTALHAHLRAARTEFESQVERARADFEEANERIKARTGRDLILAILIGLAIGVVLLLSLIIWKPVFLVFALAAVGLGLFELTRAMQGSGRRVDLAPQLAGGAALVLSGWFLSAWLHWVVLIAVVILVIVWRLLGQMVVHDGRRHRDVADDVLAGGLMQLYVSFLASLCVILLRQDHGEYWVLAFIIIAVAADTGAYITGLTLGRHPMAPRISPKKTWEGFAGAVAAALIAGVLLALFMLNLPWWAGLVIGAVILATATIGDLGESMIKRDLGIKDMSSWLPGHGGVLDRLDSILPSAGGALALYLLLTPLVVS
ncbi:phosphatidate cytidylyltransferase [Microbacterium luticocti]|uniref:phosphatidate cytidylyltransferase n=1 Tax=Microbacterium luticocti TaxID=451764 RepID=UPI000418592C|nr:phosphatidate cytidylyltransferase [Microbacterium luticocti]